MGAWGMGYNENDDFYNDTITTFAEPLIEIIALMLDGGEVFFPEHVNYVVRPHLVLTHQALSGASEASLDGDAIATLRKAVEMVRESAKQMAPDWEDPSDYLAVVDGEMTTIETWLDGFEPSQGLMDRIPSILAARAQHDG